MKLKKEQTRNRAFILKTIGKKLSAAKISEITKIDSATLRFWSSQDVKSSRKKLYNLLSQSPVVFLEYFFVENKTEQEEARDKIISELLSSIPSNKISTKELSEITGWYYYTLKNWSLYDEKNSRKKLYNMLSQTPIVFLEYFFNTTITERKKAREILIAELLKATLTTEEK